MNQTSINNQITYLPHLRARQIEPVVHDNRLAFYNKMNPGQPILPAIKETFRQKEARDCLIREMIADVRSRQRLNHRLTGRIAKLYLYLQSYFAFSTLILMERGGSADQIIVVVRDDREFQINTLLPEKLRQSNVIRFTLSEFELLGAIPDSVTLSQICELKLELGGRVIEYVEGGDSQTQLMIGNYRIARMNEQNELELD